ncbi:caspase domain-containing protein [Armillaria novae-zelandiae]|uniref:Caspase domain-containing protein n=1 Tax=Armillaria novae-zelandiae TaxID=153914 RepID=A0AA39PIP3_9AGAR|nr:caspase domain-containing protein [Armillaria novae-zelandiae]
MSENPNPSARLLVPEMDVDLCSEQDSFGTNIFALVIGVNTYDAKKYKEFQLAGAVNDANAFQQYLLEDLQVPIEHITSLRDKTATRTAIIQGFNNLAKDPRIVRGRAIIIIYFAGHGAATEKPKEWSDWESSGNKIEMLCPCDMGLPDGSGETNVIEGIPDRTISQLLAKISNTKGNNITLILDCCHSAGINRGGGDAPNTRSRQLFKPPSMSPDCDSTIWSSVPAPQVLPVTSGFSGTPWDSHILLAACSRLQTAKEIDGKGLFTHALLKVMRERHAARGELTYQSLMHCLDMPLFQRPHLDGKHIHQSVFSPWKVIPDSPRIACSYKSDQFSLHAGLIHGVTAGSTYHIYSTDQVSDPAKPIASTAVTHVGSFASRLKNPQPDFKSNKHGTWYAQLETLKSGSSFAIYCNDAEFLIRVLGDNGPSRLLLAAATVTAPDEADLCLMVEGKGNTRAVFFDRGGRNNFLSEKRSGLSSRLPNAVSSIDDIPKIRNIINHYINFTTHLDSTLTVWPTTKFVSIEMKELRDRENKPNFVGPNLLRDDDIEPIQISVESSLQKSYGFTIRNISPHNLYVYLFYFDATTLSIDVWYASMTGAGHENSQHRVDACLLVGETLDLGCGQAGFDPFQFNISENQFVDMCFFKIFVSTQEVELRSIVQISLYDLLANSRGATRIKPLLPPPVLPYSWASMIIPVVQKYAEQQPVTIRDPCGTSTDTIHSMLAPSLSPPLTPSAGTTEATHSQVLARNVPPKPTQWWQWFLTWMQRPLKVCYGVLYAAIRFLTVKRT